MSSRQEEKERRRKEREAAEAAANQSAARRKRMGIVGIGVLAAAVLVIVVLAVASGGDDDTRGGGGAPTQDAPTQGNDNNVNVAAEAAGCEVQTQRSEGRGHTTETVKYNVNPPTSGSHDPVPSEDGEYDAANPPDIEQSVHSLEHGRINFQYKKGSPPDRVAQLRDVFNEEVKGTGGYHSLFFQNQTNMTQAVVATAWTRTLSCPQWNDQVFDALRAFRKQFVDKAPEFIP